MGKGEGGCKDRPALHVGDMGEQTILLLSHRATPDREAIYEAALSIEGVTPMILDSWRAPAALQGANICMYAEPMFADVVASQIGLSLLEGKPDWLTSVPAEFLGRNVRSCTIAQARNESFPLFIKAIDDKRISPKVYQSVDDVPGAEVIDDEEIVLISEPVTWQTEIRLFCARGDVVAGSTYMIDGEPNTIELSQTAWAAQATSFARRVLAQQSLPDGIVLDVAIGEDGWQVVEANAAWASGLYASDPVGALQSILLSSMPDATLRNSLTGFVRERAQVTFS